MDGLLESDLLCMGLRGEAVVLRGSGVTRQLCGGGWKTYVLLPLLHDLDKEDYIGDMAMIYGVKGIKIQILAVLQERKKGFVDAEGRGCFRVGLDD